MTNYSITTFLTTFKDTLKEKLESRVSNPITLDEDVMNKMLENCILAFFHSKIPIDASKYFEEINQSLLPHKREPIDSTSLSLKEHTAALQKEREILKNEYIILAASLSFMHATDQFPALCKMQITKEDLEYMKQPLCKSKLSPN